MHIRTLESHEVHFHRELRLRALRDSPDSFSKAVADAKSQPLSFWEDLTRSVTTPGLHVMFLACDGESVHGLTFGLLDPERSDMGRVGGMWVEPSWRRQGLGRALLEVVFDWARDRELTHLGLWAPAHEPAAIALYQQAGFHATGNRRPLPTNPKLEIVELDCEL